MSLNKIDIEGTGASVVDDATNDRIIVTIPALVGPTGPTGPAGADGSDIDLTWIDLAVAGSLTPYAGARAPMFTVLDDLVFLRGAVTINDFTSSDYLETTGYVTAHTRYVISVGTVSGDPAAPAILTVGGGQIIPSFTLHDSVELYLDGVVFSL